MCKMFPIFYFPFPSFHALLLPAGVVSLHPTWKKSYFIKSLMGLSVNFLSCHPVSAFHLFYEVPASLLDYGLLYVTVLSVPGKFGSTDTHEICNSTGNSIRAFIKFEALDKSSPKNKADRRMLGLSKYRYI